MSSVYPLQQTFQNGIISPRVQGRSQSEGYSNALSKCENWQLKPQGSMRYRNGSKYLRDVRAASSRLFNFSRGDREDLMVEVAGNFNLRLFDRDGNVPLQGSNVQNVLNDPNFAQGLREWRWNSVDDVVGGGVVFDSQTTVPIPLAGQGVILQGNTENGLVTSQVSISQEFDVAVIGFQHIFRGKFEVSGIANLGGVGSSIEINIYEAVNDSLIGQGGLTPTPEQIANGTEFDVEFNFQVNILSRLRLEIKVIPPQVRVSGEKTLNMVTTITELQVKADTPDTQPLVFSSPYSDNIDLKQIQVAQDTAKREMYFVHPQVPVQVLKEDIDGEFSFEPLNFTAGSPDSGPTGWATTGNWPAAVEIWQGRLILANSLDQPSTIWMSATNNFTEFNQANSDSNALEFTLNTNGVIEWMRGSKVLLIGTDRALWTASSSTGVITASNFVFLEQAFLGTISLIAPQRVGDQIAFVGRDSRRVRTVNFDADLTDGYVSNEISLQADQLFNSRIIDMAYARDPDYQLAVVTGDGKLNICMVDRVTGLQGWYTYTTNGQYLGVEFSTDPTGSSFYVLVQRANRFGEPRYTVERFDAGSEETAHLDSYFIGTAKVNPDEAGVGAYSSAFSSAFDGNGFNSVYLEVPSYYNGKKLQCSFVALSATEDGLLQDQPYAHPDVYCFDGKVKLESYVPVGAIVSVGLGYKAYAETLPLEIGNQAGTGQGTKRHFNRIFSRVVNSSIYPILNGYRPVPENPDPFQETATRAVNEDIEIRNEGTQERGIITIEQDLPLNCEIACIFGKAVSKVT